MRFRQILIASLPLLLVCQSVQAAGGLGFDDFESPLVVPQTPEPRPPKLDSVPQYKIGPGDSLNIFVWRNQDLSTTVPVRPDGRISIPLVEDLTASGKTPTQLAREMEKVLSKFVKDPVVTVIVRGFQGPYSEQIRVVGEATKPQALAYREKMSLLDVMIEVGGLTDFAAGNRARIIRYKEAERKEFKVYLDDLVRDGDISANVDMLPGDVLLIPESWF